MFVTELWLFYVALTELGVVGDDMFVVVPFRGYVI